MPALEGVLCERTDITAVISIYGLFAASKTTVVHADTSPLWVLANARGAHISLFPALNVSPRPAHWPLYGGACKNTFAKPSGVPARSGVSAPWLSQFICVQSGEEDTP